MLAAASVRSLMEIVRSETWERSGPLTQAVDPSVAAVPKTILHLEFEQLLMVGFLGPWNFWVLGIDHLSFRRRTCPKGTCSAVVGNEIVDVIPLAG